MKNLILIIICTVMLVFTFTNAQSGSVTLLGAGKSAPAVPPPTGKILLVDGVSFILQTNGTSKICRAGGC